MILLAKLGVLGSSQGSLDSNSNVAVGGGSITGINFLPGPTQQTKVWIVENASVMLAVNSAGVQATPLCGFGIVPSTQNDINDGSGANVDAGNADLVGRGIQVASDVFTDVGYPDFGGLGGGFHYLIMNLKRPAYVPFGFILRAFCRQNNGGPFAATAFYAACMYRELDANDCDPIQVCGV